MSRDPLSDAEWQEAVNAAAFLLGVHSAKLYGLIETDLGVNTGLCEMILKRGSRRGFVPPPMQELVKQFIGGKR